MWAIRRASVPIKSRAISSVTLRPCYSKFETSSSNYTDNSGSLEPPPHIYDKSLLFKRFSSRAKESQCSFIGKHGFSSHAGTKSSGEEDEDDDLKDSFSDLDASSADVVQGENVEHLSDNEAVFEGDLSDEDIVVEERQNELGLSDTEEEAIEKSSGQRRDSSGLFKAIVNSPTTSAKKALDKWLEEGNDLSRMAISQAMFELRRRRMYGKALQLSEWLESQEKVEFSERDYASRVDLIFKIRGLQKAESYVDKIPESFKGEIIYRTLLANCVISSNTKKAEQIFNKIKSLKLPLTIFTCNQLLLLYKRTDKRKIADVLLLMEKENIKPSLFTYRILIDTKALSNDISGMEQILETMKSDGLEPDSRLQAVLARHYVYAGMKEKALSILKQMEGNDLNENRRVCSSLLHVYSLMGSVEDVKRVWAVCESHPRLDECLNAINAWGKLKKVEEAEKVFDEMLKRWKKLTPKQYTAMLKVYASNKMLSKGKDLVKKMAENGCRVGPLTLDALVKLYVEAGEIEKADSVLNKGSGQINMKPLFASYMMILDGYAKRGDVDNAEKIFYKMRRDGYVSRLRQYHSLLEAYVNAKAPVYGFRERMKADNMFPSKALAEQLAKVDAFKKNKVLDLLD